MKYRKKPVEVDAIQFLNGDGKSTISDCLRFCGTNEVELEEDFMEGGMGLIIPTLEGNMRADNGDWIIKRATVAGGEFCVCKPDIFEKTYEKVEE